MGRFYWKIFTGWLLLESFYHRSPRRNNLVDKSSDIKVMALMDSQDFLEKSCSLIGSVLYWALSIGSSLLGSLIEAVSMASIGRSIRSRPNGRPL